MVNISIVNGVYKQTYYFLGQHLVVSGEEPVYITLITSQPTYKWDIISHIWVMKLLPSSKLT